MFGEIIQELIDLKRNMKDCSMYIYDVLAIKVEINFLAKAVTVHTFPRKLKLWEKIPLNLDFTLCDSNQ